MSKLIKVESDDYDDNILAHAKGVSSLLCPSIWCNYFSGIFLGQNPGCSMTILAVSGGEIYANLTIQLH